MTDSELDVMLERSERTRLSLFDSIVTIEADATRDDVRALVEEVRRLRFLEDKHWPADHDEIVRLQGELERHALRWTTTPPGSEHAKTGSRRGRIMWARRGAEVYIGELRASVSGRLYLMVVYGPVIDWWYIDECDAFAGPIEEPSE